MLLRHDFSARACLRLPGASTTIGQSAGWAALAGLIGLAFVIGGDTSMDTYKKILEGDLA